MGSAEEKADTVAYEPPELTDLGSFQDVTLGSGTIVIDYNGYYWLD